MLVKYDEASRKYELYLSQDDQCFTCKKTETCPLLNAVQAEFVLIKSDQEFVKECPEFIEDY